MISLWKLREKKNVAQMHFVKITPDLIPSFYMPLTPLPLDNNFGSSYLPPSASIVYSLYKRLLALL